MALFRRNRICYEVSAPELERKLENAEKRLEAEGREFHKKKAICGITAIEIFLDGLKQGKLKNE